MDLWTAAGLEERLQGVEKDGEEIFTSNKSLLMARRVMKLHHKLMVPV